MSKGSKYKAGKVKQEEIQFPLLSPYFDVPEGIGKDEIWNRIVQSIETKKTPVRRLTIARISLLAAASIALLFISWFSFTYFNTRKILVPAGKTALIELPDNSKVHINAGSTLKYKKWGWNKNREVELWGEAFFNVNKGNTFVVKTKDCNIVVVGTEFNVLSRLQKTEVTCFSGKVNVLTPDDQLIPLEKGKSLELKQGKNPQKKQIDNWQLAPAWQLGEYYFDADSLSFVLEELQRQYNIKIHTQIPGDRVYTGFFKKGNLQESLENICLPMGLEFKILDKDNVSISSE